MNDLQNNADLTSICDGCPAAYALGVYADQASGNDAPELSPARQAMQQHEAEVAGEILNRAAGSIACQSLRKRSIELPDTVPAVGSPALIALVSRCPSFAPYLSERTGSPKSIIKLGLFVTRSLAVCRGVFSR